MNEDPKMQLKDLVELSESGPAPKAKRLDIQILAALGAEKGKLVTVKLTGSLDTASAPDLERALVPVTASGVKEVVFDLTGLKFITSAGLRIFSMVRKTCKERGGQAAFINLQPQIQAVFEIIKSLPGVSVFKDVAEFDNYLAVRQRSCEENRR